MILYDVEMAPKSFKSVHLSGQMNLVWRVTCPLHLPIPLLVFLAIVSLAIMTLLSTGTRN